MRAPWQIVVAQLQCGMVPRLLLRATVLVAMSGALAGCPSKADQTLPVPAACRAFGQQCMFAPGKLGACVLRENCTGDQCFICQSQH